MGKKKRRGLLSGVAAKAIHHPIVQKAIADLAVATLLAIAAKLAESKTAARLGRKVDRKLEGVAGVSKSKPKATRRRTA